jgi:predicted ATPase
MQVNMTNFMKVFNDAVNKGVQQKLVKSGETQNLTTGEKQEPADVRERIRAAMEKIKLMKPGKEKDEAFKKMFEMTVGIDVDTYIG